MPDAIVVVFATEEDRWFEGSRYVRATRPDREGQSKAVEWKYLVDSPGE